MFRMLVFWLFIFVASLANAEGETMWFATKFAIKFGKPDEPPFNKCQGTASEDVQLEAIKEKDKDYKIIQRKNADGKVEYVSARHIDGAYELFNEYFRSYEECQAKLKQYELPGAEAYQ